MDNLSISFGVCLLLALSYTSHASERGGLLSALSEKKTETGEKTRKGAPHYCDSYNKRPHDSTPCSKEELDEDGVCNKTQKCDESVDRSHCFMSWRNESGVVSIVSSGCWLYHDECVNKPECRTFNNTAINGVFFCCCEGNSCNSKFHLDPATDVEDDGPETVNEPYNHWMILVYVLVPLFVFCCLVILTFYVYRRHKDHYDDMDGVSVDTPATATTHCTMSSFPPTLNISLPQLIDMKARGRYGKVWKAQLEDRFVAVKTFENHERASWQNEQDIFTTALMNTHENVLKFLTATKGNDSQLWLITEFHERGSLADFLKSNTVSFPEALSIIVSMAKGLSFLHEDIQSRSGEYKPAIAHRDFKSKNVLLDANLKAVVADFGLAVKFTPGESPGESHGQVGTLRYMAPEVLEGAINFQKDAFLRIDMYAFGLVMWEILLRCSSLQNVGEAQLPFEAELGSQPTMDDMQDHVVEKKLRPMINEDWKKIKAVNSICETMAECWDHDAEARLSAGCVQLRIEGVERQIANENNTPLIIPPSKQHIDSSTEVMNRMNLQMNNLNTGNPSNQENLPDKNTRQQQLADGNVSHMTTTLTDIQPSPAMQDQTQLAAYEQLDDDQDSGTFANEDTLSHDGVMEQLLAAETHPVVPAVTFTGSEHDSATSLLMPDEKEYDL